MEHRPKSWAAGRSLYVLWERRDVGGWVAVTETLRGAEAVWHRERSDARHMIVLPEGEHPDGRPLGWPRP